MKISVRELRAISDKLWDHLAAEGYDEIEVPYDFYWDIPEEALHDLNHPPAEHYVGQLSDDWSFLQNLLDSNRDPVAYELVKLSAIVRAIGMQIVT